jgi:hypothetical protein
MHSGVDELDLAGEIAGGRRDCGDAQSGAVPDDTSVVQFGDGEIEAVAKFVFDGADYLATVFERLCVRNFQLDDQFGDRHFEDFWLGFFLTILFIVASRNDDLGRDLLPVFSI